MTDKQNDNGQISEQIDQQTDDKVTQSKKDNGPPEPKTEKQDSKKQEIKDMTNVTIGHYIIGK
jgi:hypothetical protein